MGKPEQFTAPFTHSYQAPREGEGGGSKAAAQHWLAKRGVGVENTAVRLAAASTLQRFRLGPQADYELEEAHSVIGKEDGLDRTGAA